MHAPTALSAPSPRRAVAVTWLAAFVALTSLGCDDKKAETATTTASASTGAAPGASASGVAASASGGSATRASTATTSAPTTSTALAKAPEAIAAQHVLVAYKGAERAPKTVTRSKAEAKKRADEVEAIAKSGTDFTTLVADYSDDPGAKERLGSLGKFTREKMTKPFSDAAFALKVDETSGVVETPFGFHVIKRNQ